MSRQIVITATRTALLAAAVATSALQAAGPPKDTGDWKGSGNVVDIRCQAMMQGPNCITPADRKAAAARAKATRDAAAADQTAAGAQTQNNGGQTQ